MLKFLQYLPIFLSIFDALKSLVDATKTKRELVQKNLETTKQQLIIKNNIDKLSDIAYRLLPDNIKKTADPAELKAFLNACENTIDSLVFAVEKFIPLTK